MKPDKLRGWSARGATGLVILALVAWASPAVAVLPPGANEANAAHASVVVIAKVVEMQQAAGRQIAQCQVLAKGRGDLTKGTQFTVALDSPPLGERTVGPQVIYHRMHKGQVWLLLLHRPIASLAKISPVLARAYHIAAHGWYTQRLDNLGGASELLAKLPQDTDGLAAQDAAGLREIYQWAAREAFGH